MIKQRLDLICVAAAAAGFFGIIARADAHDTWLVAETQSVASGESVRVSLRTGEVFPISDVATTPDRVAEFDVLFGHRRSAIGVVELTENSLRANSTLADDGFHVVGCSLRPRLITMNSKDFERYLESEEARNALSTLRESSADEGPITEQYTKLTKTIVRVGQPDAADRGYAARLGQRLEIIPLTNPFEWRSGGVARVQVLLDGHPWAGVVLSAGHEGWGRHEYVYRGRTNADGEASIPLGAGGLWFIKAYHMREAGPLSDHAWESLWSSLTFAVQGDAARPALAPKEKATPAREAPSADLTADVRAITAVHGELSPYAALGFRMGKRALADLGMSPGDQRLMAVYRTPFSMPYSAAADGIQAATRTTIGRLSLLIAKADATELHADFLNQEERVTVQCRPRSALLNMIDRVGSAPAAEELAVRILGMADDDLFIVTRENAVRSGALAPDGEKSESADAAVAEGGRETRKIRRPIRMMGLSEALSAGCDTDE